jgi:hypothetical protein
MARRLQPPTWTWMKEPIRALSVYRDMKPGG